MRPSIGILARTDPPASVLSISSAQQLTLALQLSGGEACHWHDELNNGGGLLAKRCCRCGKLQMRCGCSGCTETFPGGDRRRFYCDADCRREARNQRKREATAARKKIAT